jgi:transcriptional regulator with XRE-family HTH domain
MATGLQAMGRDMKRDPDQVAVRFTQIELAAELGISQRMVAYYESPAATPPANLLPQIATALGVTIDEMFGPPAKRKLAKQEGDSRLRRRLLAIEKLDVATLRLELDRRGALAALPAGASREALVATRLCAPAPTPETLSAAAEREDRASCCGAAACVSC